jgi:hypothetical protein
MWIGGMVLKMEGACGLDINGANRKWVVVTGWEVIVKLICSNDMGRHVCVLLL